MTERETFEKTETIRVNFRCHPCERKVKREAGAKRVKPNPIVRTFERHIEGARWPKPPHCGFGMAWEDRRTWKDESGAEVHRERRSSRSLTRESLPRQECPDCSRAMPGKMIVGHLDESKECDARCMGATGHQCECSCGGQNHGAAHQLGG